MCVYRLMQSAFRTFGVAFIAVLLWAGRANAGETREYRSPNGKFRAVVIALPGAPYGSGESRVELRTAGGALLCSHSYGSEDGEHGFGVERAAWTPDSRFFVYSMSSSGGHQAWHFPTDFIAVKNHRVQKLDDFTGPITDPDFEVHAPDVVHTVGRGKEDLEEKTFGVALSSLVSKGTHP